MVYLIMGVLGSGKTTIGEKLSQRLGCEFRDGDDFHPQSNRDKMAAGIPLTDSDRKPWLLAIRSVIDSVLSHGDFVVTCSALRENYRRILIHGRPGIKLVYLKGSKELISGRLKGRSGHFVSPGLLDSQFETLEEPKNAITVDIAKKPDEIVEEILSHKQ